jgi:fucose permease
LISEPQAQDLPANTKKPRPKGAAAYFAVILTFYVIAEIALSTRMVLFARREAGLSSEDANLLLSGFFLLLFLGRMVFAMAHVKIPTVTVLVVSALLSLFCFSLGLIYHPLWLAGCGLAMSVFYPTSIALLGDELREHAAFATSWCVTLQSFGLMMMHYLLGALSDLWSLGQALWIGPLCLVFVLAMLVNLPRARVKLEW